MLQADRQVPQEVARREALHHAARAAVAPDTAAPVHARPLRVAEDDGQGGGVDEAALDERHDAHVPVHPGARCQLAVGPRDEVRRQQRRGVGEEHVVAGPGEEHLVDVEGQRGQGEALGERLDGAHEEARRGEEGVEHRECRAVSAATQAGAS